MAQETIDNKFDEEKLKQIQDQSSANTGTIDDKLKDTGKRDFYKKGLLGKIFDYTVGTAFAAGATALMGPMALVGPATAILGDYIVNRKLGKKISSRQIRDNMIIGSIISIPAIFGFNLMNKYIPMDTLKGILTRAVVQTGPFYFGLAPLGYAVDYAVRPYKNKSLGNLWDKHMKPFWVKNWRDGALYFSAPNQLAANFLPPIWHYPVSRGLGLIYRGTVGQRLLKAEDPYGIFNGDNNYSDRNQNKSYNKTPAIQPNYG